MIAPPWARRERQQRKAERAEREVRERERKAGERARRAGDAREQRDAEAEYFREAGFAEGILSLYLESLY